MHVSLIHFAVRQKLTQHSKATPIKFTPIKIKKKRYVCNEQLLPLPSPLLHALPYEQPCEGFPWVFPDNLRCGVGGLLASFTTQTEAHHQRSCSSSLNSLCPFAGALGSNHHTRHCLILGKRCMVLLWGEMFITGKCRPFSTSPQGCVASPEAWAGAQAPWPRGVSSAQAHVLGQPCSELQGGPVLRA